MFNDLLSYSGIVTKTKAMHANLISVKDYEDISNISSVTDFINFLKDKPAYQELLASYNERMLHRNEIEHIITNALFLDYAKLFRFATLKQRKSMDFLFFRYEINILKSCLQNIYSTDDHYDLLVFEPFFASHSELNIKNLAASHTLAEFMGHLKDTRYYHLFQRINNTAGSELYDIEVQLDIYYYTTIWRMCKKTVKTKEQLALKDMIGKEIDFLNIIWIYRFKKSFDVDSSTLLASIIPIHYKLTSKQLMGMIEAGSLEEFFHLTAQTCYYDAETDIRNPRFSIEVLHQDMMYKLHHRNMKRFPTSMCTIQYYLFKKELEINRLTTAMECIRYGLEPQKILDYILK